MIGSPIHIHICIGFRCNVQARLLVLPKKNQTLEVSFENSWRSTNFFATADVPSHGLPLISVTNNHGLRWFQYQIMKELRAPMVENSL